MRKKSKLLTVMLLGPTATGKSETAKSLAEVLSDATGTKYGFIELAGNEFVGEHSVHRFFGAPPGYVGHGQLQHLMLFARTVITVLSSMKWRRQILS